MKTTLLVRKADGALIPDESSWEDFDTLPDQTFVITVRKARNPEHHKKYWAIARAAADADPEWDDADDADHWVRISIPWMRKEYQIGEGRIGIRLNTINMDEMDQLEFEKFYDRAIELWSMRLGQDVEQLLRDKQTVLPKSGSFDR